MKFERRQELKLGFLIRKVVGFVLSPLHFLVGQVQNPIRSFLPWFLETVRAISNETEKKAQTFFIKA